MNYKKYSLSAFATFYIVFAYIVAFSLWWAYLLYAKNETAYKENIELKSIRYEQLHSGQDFTATTDYDKLHSKYKRQRFMILTEGSVFIALLLIGLMRVRKVFLQEMELASQQRNFLLSITHELKSPLSTVKLSLQTLHLRKLDAEKSEKLITNSLVDLNRLESLVDNILFAAKIERDEPGFFNEEINVSEVITKLSERFLSNKKNISIHLNLMPRIYLHADMLGFTSVIINLIENAIKYSEENTTVNIELKEGNGIIEVRVADKGTGILDEDKKKVFTKFYRVGNENTRRTKGTGLGLYIVKRFVEIYKGKIYIEDNPAGGSVFILHFYQANTF